jgi:hypothetical protein
VDCGVDGDVNDGVDAGVNGGVDRDVDDGVDAGVDAGVDDRVVVGVVSVAVYVRRYACDHRRRRGCRYELGHIPAPPCFSNVVGRVPDASSPSLFIL